MNIAHTLYRLKYRFGNQLPLRVPVDVSLELSSACNQVCTYCYHADPKNLPFKRGMMPYEIAIKIIDEAADLGVNSLKFNWKGESTLHPDFKAITTYARMRARGGTFIDRLTNSNFKFPTEREDIFEGLCNQTKVKVSFDSFDKKVFETQRAGGIWDLTYQNLRKFHDHPSRKNTELVIQAVRTNLNKDEDIAGRAAREFPDAKISIRDMVAGRVEKDVTALENKSRDLSERQSCLQAHVRLIFNHEGKAAPCCPSIKEDLILGDIRIQSMRDIFNGELARQLRKDLKSGKAFEQDPCKTCSSFESYKGYVPTWNS
jgi:radical SAM protein with 4Fe4S-binding SPASM domain